MTHPRLPLLDDFSIHPCHVPEVDMQRFEPDLFVGCDRFFHYLETNYTKVDLMTFTCPNPDMLKNVGRVICGALPTCSWRKAQVYITSNNHMKLFLCRSSKATLADDVYIGSQNYSQNELHELMVAVSPLNALTLANYFDALWQQLKPISPRSVAKPRPR